MWMDTLNEMGMAWLYKINITFVVRQSNICANVYDVDDIMNNMLIENAGMKFHFCCLAKRSHFSGVAENLRKNYRHALKQRSVYFETCLAFYLH